MDTTQRTARQRAQRLFARNLDLISQGRVDEWLDLFHPDGVLEFPFRPPGFPAVLRGREAMRAHMRHFPEQLEVAFSAITFHDALDPALVVAEFTSRGTALATGNAFEQTYVSLVWTEADRIVRFRDFWDPLVITNALGGAENTGAAVAD